MKCKNCNAELLDNTAFCPYCGTKCEEQVIEVLDNMEYIKEFNEQCNEEPTCWEKFGNVAHVLSNVTIATFWIPILGVYSMLTGIPAIVFSSLAKKSKKETVISKAKSSFIKSLIGTILSFVIFIFWVVLIELSAY